jgi:hypothetical protein
MKLMGGMLRLGRSTQQLDQVRLLAGFSFGCLPRIYPLAFATRMPSLVRDRMRSASHSATILTMLIGPATDGALLEIGVLDLEKTHVIDPDQPFGRGR